MTYFSEITQLPDAVFWDWDGTIADSYQFLNNAHNHTLKTLGFPIFKDGEYKNYFGKPREILYPAIYKDKSEEAKDIFQTYVLENSHLVQTIPGTHDVLEIFYQKKIPMGVVSNKKGDFVSQELKHTDCEQYFSVVVGAGEAQEDKPSGAPLNLALQKARINKEIHTVWYIGDTENDLACAQDAGCQALFLKGDENTDKLIQQYKPIASFDNYQQLKEFLVAI